MTIEHVVAVVDDATEVCEVLLEQARSRLAEGALVVLAADDVVQHEIVDRIGRHPGLKLASRHDRSDPPMSRLVDSESLVEVFGGPQPIYFMHHVAPIAAERCWEWTRVESVASMTLAVDGQLCVYSRHDLGPEQLAAALPTHALRHHGGSTGPNPDAEDAHELLRRLMREPAPEPVGELVAEMADPPLDRARAAIAAAALHARLVPDAATALMFGVNEAVWNARLHGRPPVQLSLWAAPGRLQVAVADTGPGPVDPTIGLLRRTDDGMGMWLSHQLLDVRHEIRDDGYVVHLTTSNDAQPA